MSYVDYFRGRHPYLSTVKRNIPLQYKIISGPHATNLKGDGPNSKFYFTSWAKSRGIGESSHHGGRQGGNLTIFVF